MHFRGPDGWRRTRLARAARSRPARLSGGGLTARSAFESFPRRGKRSPFQGMKNVLRVNLARRTGAGLFLAGSMAASGQAIPIPNGSFESPGVDPAIDVTTTVGSWQKAPQPAYFNSSVFGFTWDQTAGLFGNTPPGNASHIDNVDGNQAAYLLPFADVGLSQTLSSSYAVGFSYELTVGVLGKSMPADGDVLTLSLYYTSSGNPVTVASTAITYTAASLPSGTHLTDFTVNLPAVQAGNAWADQGIGVAITSTSGAGAGYWDVDNVRLSATAVPEPGSLALAAFGLGGLLLATRRFSASN